MLRTITTHQLLKSTSLSVASVTRIVVPGVRTLTTKSDPNQAAHSNVTESMPRDVYREVLDSRPIPMREEFMINQKLTTEALEKIDFGPGKHHIPKTMGDKMAYYGVKCLRTIPDTYFGRDHYMRAVMLETIAAVPGMVGGMLRHMKSLRSLSDDNGWISHLLHEAENERFHLMTFMKCLQPSKFNRLLILGAQGVFYNAYFFLYLCSPKNAHRMCGYLEEEAVISYTHFLDDLDSGAIKNDPAPEIAIGRFHFFLLLTYSFLKKINITFSLDYYNLQPTATIRDVVLAIRADEAVHRDANHFFSDRIAAHKENILEEVMNKHKEGLSQQQQKNTSAMA